MWREKPNPKLFSSVKKSPTAVTEGERPTDHTAQTSAPQKRSITMVIRHEPVPLLRCRYLKLFFETFEDMGREVSSDMSEASLPAELPACDSDHVPALPVFDFVAAAAHRHGTEELGYLAAARIKLDDMGTELRRELEKANTVRDALASYCRLAYREQSHAECRLGADAAGETLISGSTLPSTDPGKNQYSEWLLVMSMIALIRHAAGREWHPAAIAFQSQPPIGSTAWRAFPRTQFLVAQHETGLKVPTRTLDLPWPGHTVRKVTGSQPGPSLPVKLASSRWDFPNSLRSAIRPYLGDGYPSIELAAELAGTSVRTLQRRLSQHHMSYSEVVKRLRFELAAELLSDPEKTVMDAACDVGFSDPSHFSRLFRQMSGVSPREYRRHELAA
jgi:AraC-like DNA-binding protein